MVDIAKKDKLLSQIVNKTVDLEEQVESEAESYKVRYKQILLDPGQRDPKLWDQLLTQSGLDPGKWADLTLDQLFSIPRHLRGKKYNDALDAFFGAARRQTDLEIIHIPAIELAYDRRKETRSVGLSMDRETAQAAATEGMKQKIKDEKQRRKDGKTTEDTRPSATD
jgi:hypothetical protein